MINKVIKTFEKWGYPFITRDLVGWDDNSKKFHKENDNLILGGAVIFNDTTTDELKDFMSETIAKNSVAVMIDFSNMINSSHFYELKKEADEFYINKHGFIDSESYKDRLSYVKG